MPTDQITRLGKNQEIAVTLMGSIVRMVPGEQLRDLWTSLQYVALAQALVVRLVFVDVVLTHLPTP